MAENRPSTKSFEVTTYKGEPARRYEDGTIRHPRGYILYLPPEIVAQRQVQQRAKARMAAEETLQKVTDSETPEEGWGKILAARIEVAINDKGRPGNDAARLVGIALGYYANEKRVDGTIEHKAILPSTLPQKYLDHIKQLAERDVVEGRIINDETTGDDEEELFTGDDEL